MSGDDLLTQLQGLAPEQRKLDVVLEVRDIGKFRKTVRTSADRMRLINLDEDGDEDDDEPNYICISPA